MRVYVSGAISGVVGYRAIFDAAADKLRAKGHEVVNPAELNLGVGATWHDYMRLCVAMLCPGDEIYMLAGWEASSGAKEERRIAKMLGIPVTYADEVTA